MRDVGLTQTARRLPNRPTVATSSRSRARLGSDHVAVEPDELEWIGGIVDRCFRHETGALVDEARIGAKKEKHGDARIGPPEKRRRRLPPLTATIKRQPDLARRHGESRLDLLRQGLGKADVRIARSAHSGEPLE